MFWRFFFVLSRGKGCSLCALHTLCTVSMLRRNRDPLLWYWGHHGPGCLVLPSLPPLPMPPPPHSNAPPTRNEESSPPCQCPPSWERRILAPSWVFVEESHVFAYFVAATCCELDIQDYFGHEGEVYHGWKCLWPLFEQYCILPFKPPPPLITPPPPLITHPPGDPCHPGTYNPPFSAHKHRTRSASGWIANNRLSSENSPTS